MIDMKEVTVKEALTALAIVVALFVVIVPFAPNSSMTPEERERILTRNAEILAKIEADKKAQADAKTKAEADRAAADKARSDRVRELEREGFHYARCYDLLHKEMINTYTASEWENRDCTKRMGVELVSYRLSNK